MKENSFKIVDEKGLEKECKIICLIKDEENNRDYLVYSDNNEIIASSFTLENEKYILSPITDEELEYVNVELNKKVEEAFKEEKNE